MKVVLQNITKIFASRNKKVKDEVIAVNDFNLEIPDGKLVCLLGPSGCGKSTTLYMISGLQEPSSGKIFFGDDDVTKLSPENRGIGLVFQNYALYPHMTVQQNILFPLQNLKGENKLSKEEMLTRASEAAKLVQIEEYMDRKPSELSGGQQQRVAIARALVKMPRVLLLDEPLSNLDARLRLQTREEIRRIQRRTQITTIFVTHDQEEAMSISDYIVIMKLGVIMQTGKPQWVYDDPANLFVAKFLGAPPINVFTGKVENGKLYIGEECVLDVDGVEDQEVYVGIRPEGFILDKNGKLSTTLTGIDVMGRDISVVSTCESSLNPVVRSIISADEMGNIAGGSSGSSVDHTASADGAEQEKANEDVTVKFNLKPHKVLIFNKETEQRVYFGDQLAAHEQMIAEMEAEGQGYVTHNGPLPREADDVDKKATAPAPKKNIFVRAIDGIKGLFSKKKETAVSADGKAETTENAPPAVDEAPVEPTAENIEQTAAVVEAMAPSPESAANEPAAATDAAPEVQSAPEAEPQSAPEDEQAATVAEGEPVAVEEPVAAEEKPAKAPSKKPAAKKTTTAKKPATTAKKTTTTAKKSTTAKKTTATAAKKPAATAKKSTGTTAKKTTTTAKKPATAKKSTATTKKSTAAKTDKKD
ncbi:MAG: ATP-binding cassette domain-containing protein [Clostridiales bacterium]|nr:ATP-binding cassette domain-containing protein [Clostridiales bacterium]